MNEKFQDNEEHDCNECEERLKPGKAVWLELVEGTGDYYFHGIPKKLLDEGYRSQGWFPFGSTCAKNRRCD